MNQEEFIAKLQMVYVGDRNAFNEIVKEHEDLVSYACDLEDEICNLKGENQRLNNVLNELEKEINRLLERQYESEKFAKEQGFNTYLPVKVNLEYIKKRLNELKESDK